MALEGIIWDLDGTLIDTLPLCIAAFRRALEPLLERQVADAEIVAHFGVTEEGIVRRLAPLHAREAHRAYLAAYEDLHDAYARLFDGIVQILDGLRSRGVRQAVVTGKGYESAVVSIERLGLAGYFEHMEVGSPERPNKPDGLRVVLDHWQMQPSHSAYVGDTPTDMLVAAELGMAGLAAAWAESTTVSPDLIPAPTALFSRVEDLMPWVDRQLGRAV